MSSCTCRRCTGEAARSDFGVTTFRPPSRTERGRRGTSRSICTLGEPSAWQGLDATGLHREPLGTSRTEQAGTTSECAETGPLPAVPLLPPRKPLAASAALAVSVSMRPSMEP